MYLYTFIYFWFWVSSIKNEAKKKKMKNYNVGEFLHWGPQNDSQEQKATAFYLFFSFPSPSSSSPSSYFSFSFNFFSVGFCLFAYEYCVLQSCDIHHLYAKFTVWRLILLLAHSLNIYSLFLSFFFSSFVSFCFILGQIVNDVVRSMFQNDKMECSPINLILGIIYVTSAHLEFLSFFLSLFLV